MRYLVLVLLNTPIILIALINIVAQYKIKKASFARFKHQLIIWLFVLTVLIGSFPIYNLLTNKPLLDSRELSLFDIIQTTAIVLLFYIANNQRQHNEQIERRLRDLHQEMSILLSKK